MRAILFDFDGLILDTETPEFEVWSAIFREHGGELPEAWWLNTIGRGAEQVVTLPEDVLEEQIGRPVDRPRLKVERRRRILAEIEKRSACPGVLELVADAKANEVQVAVVSSSGHEWIEGHLQRLGIQDRFDHIVGAEDAERGKPWPDLYLEGLRRCGVAASEAVALEDSANGLRAARTAGIFAVAVPNPISRRLDLRHADARLESLAGVTVASLREIASGSGTLDSDRLLMTPWTEDDAEDAFRIYREPHVMRFLAREPVADVEEARMRMAMAAANFHAFGRGYGYWKIVRRSENDVIGTVLVKPLGDSKVEVGWHLHPDHWGNGYATEAARAAVEHAFRTLGLPAIYAIALPDNDRSLAVMRRLGMQRVGRTRDYYDLELEMYALEAR